MSALSRQVLCAVAVGSILWWSWSTRADDFTNHIHSPTNATTWPNVGREVFGHQHRTNHHIHMATGAYGGVAPYQISPHGFWQNRKYVSPFVASHGYMDNEKPARYFVHSARPQENGLSQTQADFWNNAENSANIRNRIDEAFFQWIETVHDNGLRNWPHSDDDATPGNGLPWETGVYWQPATSSRETEVHIKPASGEHFDEDALAWWNHGDQTIYFNLDHSWHLGQSTEIPQDSNGHYYKDFLSTSLHEIGHVLGLDHFGTHESGALMHGDFSEGGGVIPPGEPHLHRTIDASAVHGIKDLYAVSKPFGTTGSVGVPAESVWGPSNLRLPVIMNGEKGGIPVTVNTPTIEATYVAEASHAEFSLGVFARDLSAGAPSALASARAATMYNIEGDPSAAGGMRGKFTLTGDFTNIPRGTGSIGGVILEIADFEGNLLAFAQHDTDTGTNLHVSNLGIDEFSEANWSGSLEVPFLVPLDRNNGIHAYLWALADNSGTTFTTDFVGTARLTMLPPPGVTVTLATGQVFHHIPSIDFNSDGLVDLFDIDALVIEIVSGTDEATFDLSGDATVDHDDLDQWLLQAAIHNSFGQPYLLGDSNLDGTVNSIDLNELALNWRQEVTGWSLGDFTADGETSAADLNQLALNWRKSIDTAEPVPEPSALLSLVAGIGLTWRRVRRWITRRMSHRIQNNSGISLAAQAESLAAH